MFYFIGINIVLGQIKSYPILEVWKNCFFESSKRRYRPYNIGGSVRESKPFFTEDVVPRWASNHRPLHGNYGDE